MSSKKKDLEIVYNLQWKSRSTSADDKSNMVGIYDIPAITLNWDTFKSYLLKNSGTTGDDVRVSYIDSDKQEVSVDSQMDFQVALYSIRQRARLGEIITLKLDRVADQRKTARAKRLKCSSDVQTQVEVDMKPKEPEQAPEWFLKYMKKFKEEIVEEVTATVNMNVKMSNLPMAPHHSRKSKGESYKRVRKVPLLTSEVNGEKEMRKTIKLERRLETKLEKLEHKTLKIKAKKLALGRSSDSDAGRSSSKSRPIGVPLNDSDFLMDANPVNQLDINVPHMTGGETYKQFWEVVNSGKLPWTSETELRYAWGSQALMPMDRKVLCPTLSPGEKGRVAVLLQIPESAGNYECYWHFYHKGRRFGHWLGCHIIVDESAVKNHKYDIINIGDKYELVLPATWSSTPKKENAANESKDEAICDTKENSLSRNNEVENDVRFSCFPLDLRNWQDGEKLLNSADNKNIDVAEDVSARLDALKMDGGKASALLNCGSDSDNQSIVSIADSNTSLSSGDEFVVVPMPQLDMQQLSANLESYRLSENRPELLLRSPSERGDNNNNEVLALSDPSIRESVSKIQESPVDLSVKSENHQTQTEDFAMASVAANNTGYAYVYYEGRKIPMPKHYLRADYLATAEEAPAPIVAEKPSQSTSQSQTELTSYSLVVLDDSKSKVQKNIVHKEYADSSTSHCSATGSSFSDLAEQKYRANTKDNNTRLFVFPQSCPGFEVVYPSLEQEKLAQGVPEIRENAFQPKPAGTWSTCSGMNYNNARHCDYNLSRSGYDGRLMDPYFSHNGSMSASCGSPLSPYPSRDYEPYTTQMADFNNPPPMNTTPIRVTSPCSSRNTAESHCQRQRYNEQANIAHSCASNASHQGSCDNGMNKTANRLMPENVLTGAAILASSAINTARNVLNMVTPQRKPEVGRWENGHWISTNLESKREAALRTLEEMGFWHRDYNATLLARYDDDIARVIADLVHQP